MESTLNQNQITPKSKPVLIFLSTLFGFIGITGLALHVSPIEMLNWLAGFAKHHYFLVGFISLVLAIICLKLYVSGSESSMREGITLRGSKIKRLMKRKNFFINLRKSLTTKNFSTDSNYIQKERIISLKFTRNEVLTESSAIEKRCADLQKALFLSNTYKQKVYIFFKDAESKKYTLATIWHADKDYVCLKGGATLPVSSIYKVEF